MSFSSLNGQQATVLKVTIPEYGTWAADVSLAESVPVPTLTSLVIGDLTMVAAVVRSASFSGAKSARIVGGGGGWRKTLSRGYYATGGGVRLAVLLSDAAKELGETMGTVTDRSMGATYARAEQPGARFLRNLIGPTWWVDTAGKTQTGPRPSGDITSQFDVIEWHGGKGAFEIATETYSDWMPGRTFKSVTVPARQVISMVSINQDNDGVLRLSVLAEAA